MLTHAEDPCKLRVQLWGLSAQPIESLNEVIGITWPQSVGSVAEGKGRVLCVGPTDWIVLASNLEATEIIKRLQSSASKIGLSTVDISDAIAVMQLSGSDVREVLAQGCGMDLHPHAFPRCTCARTRFAHVPLILHCTEPLTFHCYVSRSYQSYLASWFAVAGVRIQGLFQQTEICRRQQ